ncbi:MAG: hypothetical protein IIB81_01835 [Nanoarchaeota archaeon]|nr:hypothetical protein [Nanoarchaeota archaeon]
MRKIKLFFIFFTILLISSSVVSAGFWDWVTGKVTDEDSSNTCDSGENEMCGGIAGLTCCSGLTCEYDGVYPDAGGTCVKEETISKCSDSDDGKDYYMKGYIINEEGIRSDDECNPGPSTTENDLLEYYCTSNIQEPALGVLYNCPNGCKDGACIKSSTTTKPNQPIDLSNYPKMFISDGKFNGYLVVGDHASADNVIALSEIAASLQFEGKQTTAGTVEITRIDVSVSSDLTEKSVKLRLYDMNLDVIH